MKKSPVVISTLTLIVVLVLITAGCQKSDDNQSINGAEATSTGNSHPGGKVDDPSLEDGSITEQAIKAMLAAKSYKVLTHITGKKDGKPVADSNFEVVFIAPDKVYFYGDDGITQKRQEIFQLGDIEYKSFDGENWTSRKKAFPKYNFTPEAISEMFERGENFRLIDKDRKEDVYKSCTVIGFERPSTVYRGQKEQIVVWLDNSTKNLVRLEVLNNEDKPVTFNEESLRFFDHNSPDLLIEVPAEAETIR